MKYSEIAEMALPTETLKANRYYHGTINSRSAQSIMQHGLQGRDDPGKGHLSPVKGMVYLASDISYAIIYALGGDYRGSMVESEADESGRHRSNLGKDPFGYVFVVDGKDLADIQPDEDSVGEFLMDNSKPIQQPWKQPDGTLATSPTGEQYMRTVGWKCGVDESDSEGRQIYDYLKHSVTPNQFSKIVQGEYMYFAAGGKRALKNMQDWMKIELINRGAHLAHKGTIIPSECWRIEKSRWKEIKKSGSNFFEIAKQIR